MPFRLNTTLMQMTKSISLFRQLTQTMRKLRIGRTVFFMAILFTPLIAVACGSDDENIVFTRGRSLEVWMTRPIVLEKVSFTDSAGNPMVLRPRASNRQLAVVDVTVVNRTSIITPMIIDSDAAKLGNRRGERINALDPFALAQPLDVADSETDMYKPFLWGETVLDRNFQVEGWMVFDVPKGLVLGSFWWEEVDQVVGDFIDYTRR